MASKTVDKILPIYLEIAPLAGQIELKQINWAALTPAINELPLNHGVTLIALLIVQNWIENSSGANVSHGLTQDPRFKDKPHVAVKINQLSEMSQKLIVAFLKSISQQPF